MLTNKDIRVEGSNLIINGEKHPLDPAVNALTKRANIIQGKFSALDTRLDAIEALEKTASGNPISLTGAAAAYAISNIMTIEPIQSGSGDPSPTNVRPISGISEAVATRTGKNLVVEFIANSNISSASQIENYNGAFNVYVAPIKKGKTYIARTGNQGSEGFVYAFYTEKPARLSVAYDNTRYVGYATAFVAPIDGYIAFRSDVSFLEGQLELGSTATDYEAPATPATATITLGQTVYGGSVNFKTGEVTVTHGNISSYNGESINEPWLSSIDKYISGATPSTGAQVVYPLTTPTTLTLTPAELELLKGNNTVSGNGANINLSYIGR